MKKYLITAALAVAISGAFVSCSDDIASDSLIEQKAKTFEKVFVEAYGTPAPNHTWGFQKNDVTRSAETNSNEWGTMANNGKYKDVLKKEDIPAITADELRDVLAVFNQKGEETYTSLIEWDTFFVQQVWKGTAVHKDGYGKDVVGGNQMDWLCAYDPIGKQETIYPDWNGYQATVVTNHDDHVNNFNAANGFVMLMMNSSTRRFGYKSSSDNGHVFYYFRMEKINGMYYVGFDFSAEGQNPNEQVQRDYIYNDWIVKIVPGEGYSNEDWEEVAIREEVVEVGRVFCEDLGASRLSDIDYNDVVFDAVIIHEQKAIDGTIVSGGYYAKVCLLAAGGTLPVTVGGHEVHTVLGKNKVGTNIMINTLKEEDRAKVNGAGVTECDPVVIDRIDGVSSIDAIKINALYNNKVIEVTNNGENLAPYKLCVPIGTRWAKERVDIGGAYKSFKEYCSYPDVKFWEKEADNDSLWTESKPSDFVGIKKGDVNYYYEYRKVIWRNNGYGAVDWSSRTNDNLYRFTKKGYDYNNECLATFPEAAWNQIKSGTFYLVVEGTNPQVRVTNGYWTAQWQSDFTPSNGLIDNGDGTWTLSINFSNDASFVSTFDGGDNNENKHLLITGTGFTPVKLYYIP